MGFWLRRRRRFSSDNNKQPGSGVLDDVLAYGRGFFPNVREGCGRQGRFCVFLEETRFRFALRNEDEAAPLWEAERYRSRAIPWEHIGGEGYELND